MPLDTDSILAGLTEPQREAASVVDGATLVLAGPGSGKTRVITRRIAFLVAQGIPAWQILALTFTNKAAGEMRNRVETLVPADVPGRRGMTVATFHSFCALLLRRHAEAAGLPQGFTIYDTGDQREAMKEALSECGLSTTNWSPASTLSAVSAAKNRLLSPEEFASEASDFVSRSVAKAYAAYQRILDRNGAVDFDDLLLRTTKLLRSHEATLRELQARYRYLLIDEYQDTNRAQFVIAHAIAGSHGNVMAVGDPDQSIYGWRGADLTNILDFEERFPEAKIIPLGQNFRSTGRIVAAADGLIRHNKRRKHKDLSTELGPGEPVRTVRCPDEHDEAGVVADFLAKARDSGVEWRSMAVLYRMNALSRVVEDELRRRRVPYVIARGTAFYERKEVKDLLAYLRAIANPRDEVALRRIVNVPTRGIGDATVERLQAISIDAGTSLFDVIVRAREFAAQAGRSAKAVIAFGDKLRSWRERAKSTPVTGHGDELSPLVADVLRESGLDGKPNEPGLEGEDEIEARENRAELVSAASEWRFPDGDDGAGEPPSRTVLDALRGFLEGVALVSDADVVDAERGAVTLMTLHAAKGLEFDTVAIVGLEEGSLPHQRALEDRDGLEEERRLLFVGMTRAERRLQLSNAASRTLRGLRQSTIESQFLAELPGETLSREDRLASHDHSRIEYDADAAIDDGRPSAKRMFPVGCLVRHPQFGVGRVEHVVDRGAMSSARVAFRAVGLKTLVLSYARLERIDG